MTESIYKAQAKRLADYLSRVHGVKLKYASMLEAVASMHGQADWNTLVASAPRVSTGISEHSPVPTPLGAAPSPYASLPDSAQSFNVLFTVYMESLVRHGSTGAHIIPSSGGPQVFVRRDGVRMPWAPEFATNIAAFTAEIRRRAGLLCPPGEEFGTGQFVWVNGADQWQVRVDVAQGMGTAPSTIVRWTNQSVPAMALENLGMTHVEQWRRSITSSPGLYLVVGPTSSGCRTTLEASGQYLRSTGRSVFDYRQVRDDPALAPGARAGIALRHDFEVILFGEIRDADAARDAIQMAEAGIVVIATMHASSVNSALRRLADCDIEDAITGHLIKAILVQRLMRIVCQTCSGAGCEHCRQSGYSGRTMVSECVTATPTQSVRSQVGLDREAPRLIDDAIAKCRTGVTDARELERIFGSQMVLEHLAGEPL